MQAACTICKKTFKTAAELDRHKSRKRPCVNMDILAEIQSLKEDVRQNNELITQLRAQVDELRLGQSRNLAITFNYNAPGDVDVQRDLCAEGVTRFLEEYGHDTHYDELNKYFHTIE